ncbi:CBU_0592 family membrane protein [Roseivivax sp. CAU 1753]
MFLAFSDYTLQDICSAAGLLGVATYIANYSMLSLRILSSESTLYFVINTTAATLVMISLSQDFNMAAALIQGFFIVLGTVAISIRLHRHIRKRINARLGRAHTAHVHPSG